MTAPKGKGPVGADRAFTQGGRFWLGFLVRLAEWSDRHCRAISMTGWLELAGRAQDET
jgi:hypothetical protein